MIRSTKGDYHSGRGREALEIRIEDLGVEVATEVDGLGREFARHVASGEQSALYKAFVASARPTAFEATFLAQGEAAEEVRDALR